MTDAPRLQYAGNMVQHLCKVEQAAELSKLTCAACSVQWAMSQGAAAASDSASCAVGSPSSAPEWARAAGAAARARTLSDPAAAAAAACAASCSRATCCASCVRTCREARHRALQEPICLLFPQYNDFYSGFAVCRKSDSSCPGCISQELL